MHFFTSVGNNYIPKARILAKSVKQHCKDAKFSLVLSDKLPDSIDIEKEPFDEILLIEDLGLPVKNLSRWIFMHAVVELCTAVKGQALVKFLEQGSDKVVYLDPDIAVFDDLTELEALLDHHPTILTPHQTIPESRPEDVVNNEICSLQHGVYNFGFFAVRNNPDGLKFARWWRDRLVDFCYDDIPNGLFTDQKWGDIAPAFFENLFILRKSNYNVATWNISNRNVTQEKGDKFYVDGQPLQFYHFSGFDSGNQEAMLNLYGKKNPALWTLRNWYSQRQEEEGQQQYGKIPCAYNFFSNGEEITRHQRRLIRQRNDIYDYLSNADLFDVNDGESYWKWYHEPINEAGSDEATKEEYEQICNRLSNELYALKQSKSWRYTKWIRDFFSKLKK